MIETTGIKELMFNIFAHGWIVLIGAMGGAANYFSGVRNKKTVFAWIDFGMDIFISAAVAVVTGSICLHMEFEFYLTVAIVGVAGHMGTRAFILGEHYLRNKTGVKEK